jgi:thiol:disulfide interchange protein DsbD
VRPAAPRIRFSLCFFRNSNAAAPAATVTATATAASSFTTVTTHGALDSLLADAAAKKQAVLVDFYADWCVSCKSLEKDVFGSNAVLHALDGVKLIRVDVTDNNASVQALMREKGILGPPTVMLFDKNGVERRDARLVGEFKSADLLQRLNPGMPS